MTLEMFDQWMAAAMQIACYALTAGVALFTVWLTPRL
jgi:hypothetical protein